MNILHIDDDTKVHKLMSYLLQRFGQQNEEAIEITMFIDPVQGLFETLNHGHKYDLILLDVNMPGLTGGDIYQQIARSCPHLLGRVLFVTSYRGKLDRRFPNQQLNVLEKPLRYARLEKIIQSMVC